ncbi:MAG: 3-oxocholest-4-en-26-oate---CoA ligase [Actinomycetota bacterium]|nr:3-oxocholest-4-en-26-oate---CoA ligase [Actinomycetota bacterium]
MPDEKWGEAIVAVVEAVPSVEVDAADVIAHVKSRLAAFKAPKQVVTIDTIGRAPNGKVDYKRLRVYAAEQLGSTLPA